MWTPPLWSPPRARNYLCFCGRFGGLFDDAFQEELLALAGIHPALADLSRTQLRGNPQDDAETPHPPRRRRVRGWASRSAEGSSALTPLFNR
jgi:hypothetical protein